MSPFPIFPGAQSAHGAMVPLGTVTYTSPSTGVGFNLPASSAGFQDLMLVATLRNETPGAGFAFYFNGDVGSGNYSNTWLLGDGANITSGRSTNQNYLTWYATPSSYDAPNMFSTHIFHIVNPHPSTTTPFRTILHRWGNDKNGSGTSGLQVLSWRAATTMSALTVGATGGNFSTGSVFTLYGIRSVSQ